MRRLEVADADLMGIALQQEIVRSEEARYDHRLHGVLLVSWGFSCHETAGILGHSPRSIQHWVGRFEESGFAGLEERSGRGGPGPGGPGRGAAARRGTFGAGPATWGTARTSGMASSSATIWARRTAFA